MDIEVIQSMGTLVNRTCGSINEGSLEITATDPLNLVFQFSDRLTLAFKLHLRQKWTI